MNETSGNPDAGRRRRRGLALLIAGYLLAIALPVVGAILGILIIVRRHSWHGVAIVSISLAVVVAFLSLGPYGGSDATTPPEAERQYRRIEDCFARKLPHTGIDAMIRSCEEQAFR